MRNLKKTKNFEKADDFAETSTFSNLYDMIEELYDDSSIESDEDTMLKPTTDSVRLTFTCTRRVIANVSFVAKLTLSAI